MMKGYYYSHRQNSRAPKEFGVSEDTLPHSPFAALRLPVAVNIPQERGNPLKGWCTRDRSAVGDKARGRLTLSPRQNKRPGQAWSRKRKKDGCRRSRRFTTVRAGIGSCVPSLSDGGPSTQLYTHTQKISTATCIAYSVFRGIGCYSLTTHGCDKRKATTAVARTEVSTATVFSSGIPCSRLLQLERAL